MPELKFMVIPDCHIPYHDVKAVATAVKLLNWYKPDTVVILGDFMDCAPVSHWLKNRNKTKEGLRLKKDYDVSNRILDQLTSGVKHLIYMEGNHEDWINDAIERSPELEGFIELEHGLKFAQRRAAGLKISFFPYGKCTNLGKLWFTHGIYTCMNHAKKHVEAFGRSICYGHLHDVQMYMKVSPIDVNDKHMGLSLGCLADKNPLFMENRPNNWVHAVGVGLVRPDDTFNIDPIIISNGTASYAGKTFKA
jgi:predicted phosphodiesterase